MPASFQEILGSRLFKFIVGENADAKPTEFSIHEDAVAQLSTPLHELTKGNTYEAHARCARWEGVGKETFERFVQFAYTGDYSIPKTEKRGDIAKPKPAQPEIASPSSASSAPNGFKNGSVESNEPPKVDVNEAHKPVVENGDREQEDRGDDDSGSILNYPSIPKKKRNSKKKKKTVNGAEPEQDKERVQVVNFPESTTTNEPEAVMQLEPQAEPEPEPVLPVEQFESQDQHSHIFVTDFQTLTYPLVASRDNYQGTYEPSTDFEKDHSYSNVLLSHASLYVLGDTQLVDPLKALALFKLHKTLCIFQLDKKNIRDIIDLARYAYSVGEKGTDGRIGGLRNLVCQYMAIHAVELSGYSRFMNLLAGGGQIVKDFFRFQLQRIQ